MVVAGWTAPHFEIANAARRISQWKLSLEHKTYQPAVCSAGCISYKNLKSQEIVTGLEKW
jgi:hypothetical protein